MHWDQNWWIISWGIAFGSSLCLSEIRNYPVFRQLWADFSAVRKVQRSWAAGSRSCSCVQFWAAFRCSSSLFPSFCSYTPLAGWSASSCTGTPARSRRYPRRSGCRGERSSSPKHWPALQESSSWPARVHDSSLGNVRGTMLEGVEVGWIEELVPAYHQVYLRCPALSSM